MINGAHIVIYSKDAEADRKFFRDVLKLSSVDAGHGWLIFAMPPAEAAFHESDINDRHEFYFMCDDIAATLKDLKSKNVRFPMSTNNVGDDSLRLPFPAGEKSAYTSRSTRVR